MRRQGGSRQPLRTRTECFFVFFVLSFYDFWGVEVETFVTGERNQLQSRMGFNESVVSYKDSMEHWEWKSSIRTRLEGPVCKTISPLGVTVLHFGVCKFVKTNCCPAAAPSQ